jgi:hypothetical protein
MVLNFPLPILINQNGKLCTPVLSRKTLLTLVISQTRKMSSALCLWYDNLNVHLAPVTLCAFARVFMLCCIFACFCRAHLCLPSSSEFSIRLQSLEDLFSVNLCTAFEQETLSHALRANVFWDVTFLFVSPMRLRSGIFWSSWFISRFCAMLLRPCIAPSLLWSMFLLKWLKLCFHEFCLAPCLSRASFQKKRLRLCFRHFWAPCLLGASFLMKRLRLRFCNCWVPCLSGASFLPKWLRLRFHDFWAPFLSGASLLSKQLRLHFHDFDLSPGLLWASSVSDYFCRVSGQALNWTCPWLWVFRPSVYRMLI